MDIKSPIGLFIVSALFFVTMTTSPSISYKRCWGCSCQPQPQHSLATPLSSIMDLPNYQIIQLEDYELHLCYEELGTRSEGQRGTLWLDGQEIQGEKGDKLTIGTVTLRHYGTEKPVPWAITGWNYDDSSLIKNSWEREFDGSSGINQEPFH